MKKIFISLVIALLFSINLFAAGHTNDENDNLEKIMETKASLEKKFAYANDIATYYVYDQVISAWRLAGLNIQQTLSKSGNKILFNSEQALKFASFAYHTGINNLSEVPNEEHGSSISMLARWHYYFGDNKKFTEIKSLCIEYSSLGLDKNHRHYEFMKNLCQIARESSESQDIGGRSQQFYY